MESDSQGDQGSTEGMVDYDQNSPMQQQLVVERSSLIRDLTLRIIPSAHEFRMVDYGCGPGTSAIEAVRPAVDACREQNRELSVVVCHADQPGNDWNALFELATGPSGYFNDSESLRMQAAIGSFYDRLVADQSVDLATCFTASHWLRHAGHLNAPGTVWFADLEGDPRVEMATRARSDWIRFLKCRAEELRAGGYLLVSTLGAVPDATEVNSIAASGRGIYRAIHRTAQTMADDGLINQAVLDRFVFGLWFMTADEARAPIEADSFLTAAYEIEEISVRPAPVNASDLFVDAVDDPSTYARLYTGYTRAFADSSLRTQLFEPSAADRDEADRLEREFFKRFEELYRTFTQKYAFEIWYLTVVLRKR